MAVPEQSGAVGSHSHPLEPQQNWVVVVVSEPKCHHIEVVRHNGMAQQAQTMHHIQKKNQDQIYLMVVHTQEAALHRIAEEEEVHLVAEMVAGGDWEGNSEMEGKVPLPHGDLMTIAVEGD